MLSLVSWFNTGYHVVGRELRIYEGLLWRRTRAIPLERLQAVEVVRPLLAQLTGLAELRLEVVGGGKTEAPLAYLTVARRGRAAASGCSRWPGAPAGARRRGATGRRPGDGAAAPAGAGAGRCYAVRNRDLVVSQLLTPQAFLLPVGVAFVVLQFVLEGSLVVHRGRQHAHRDGRRAAATGPPGPDDWNFRLARDADGRLRSALRAAGDPQRRSCRWTGCSRSW